MDLGAPSANSPSPFRRFGNQGRRRRRLSAQPRCGVNTLPARCERTGRSLIASPINVRRPPRLGAGGARPGRCAGGAPAGGGGLLRVRPRRGAVQRARRARSHKGGLARGLRRSETAPRRPIYRRAAPRSRTSCPARSATRAPAARPASRRPARCAGGTCSGTAASPRSARRPARAPSARCAAAASPCAPRRRAACSPGGPARPQVNRRHSRQGLLEHLEASHRRFEFAGAAAPLGGEGLVEVRVAAAPAGGGDAAPALHPGLAPWSAEFRRRYPSWQVGTRRPSCAALLSEAACHGPLAHTQRASARAVAPCCDSARPGGPLTTRAALPRRPRSSSARRRSGGSACGSCAPRAAARRTACSRRCPAGARPGAS